MGARIKNPSTTSLGLDIVITMQSLSFPILSFIIVKIIIARNLASVFFTIWGEAEKITA